MDIWAWFIARKPVIEAAGHSFDLFYGLPDLMLRDDGRVLDPRCEQAVAVARALNDGWLELYVRHWQLQGLALHRKDARRGMELMVRTLKTMAEPANEDCPQRVCCTQDLVLMLAALDPIGHARQRAGAAAEMLARISPAWPCWSCLMCEQGMALIDAGALDEARALVEDGRRHCHAAGRSTMDSDGKMLFLAGALAVAEGEVEAGVELLDRSAADSEVPRFAAHVRAAAQAALAGAGRWEAVEQRLRQFAYRIHEHLEHHLAVAALARVGRFERERALALHRRRLTELAERDNHYASAVLALLAAEQALALDRPEEATALVATADAHALDLSQPDCLSPHRTRLSG